VVEVERIVGKYHFFGVAVIANSYWTALKARKKLNIEWDTKGFETVNSSAYEDHLRSLAGQEGLID
jgi:isoquinoline 1-oxidoreductase beta subunit